MKTKPTNNIPQKRYGVIYARYSNGPNQTEQSIEGQIHDCLSYARSHNITIIETYADRHISGKSMDHRDELKRLLNDAKNGVFSVVVTWKVDRLGRNRQDLAFNKNALKRAGVKVEYAEESIPKGPEGIILESVLEGLAEFFPPIIEKELWDIVQKRINETSQPKVKCKHAGRSYSSANFYLYGKVSCGICGNPYCGESGTGRHGEKHYYYKCLGRKKRRCECSGKTRRKDDLEGLILNFTVQDVLSDEMIDHIADLFVTEAGKTEKKMIF